MKCPSALLFYSSPDDAALVDPHFGMPAVLRLSSVFDILIKYLHFSGERMVERSNDLIN